MKLNVAVCALIMFSSLTEACDLYSGSLLTPELELTLGADSSPTMLPASGVCFSILDSMGYASKQLLALGLFEESPADSSYWADWFLKADSDPLFTHKLATSYIGFGVWIPSELLDEQSDMSTEEWLMSHGLQLSIGFGEKKAGEPRMRFDYRWHEDFDSVVMMQIEVPF